MNPGNHQIFYSVVVPVMNEERNVRPLYVALKPVMEKLSKPYEIILVDDGSTDGTLEAVKDLHAHDRTIRVIRFRRNFGQSAAMGAGFELARGEVIITMDGDLQNDPKDIPALVDKLNEGYDIVSGWRKHRHDTLLLRKIPSKIANRLIMSLTGVRLHDIGCSLKVYRKEVVKKIRLYGELHRFIPLLGRIEGARIAEISVDHHPRRFGKSKYNLTRIFKVIMDLTTLNLFVKHLMNPVHFFGWLGLLFNACGFGALAAMIHSAVGQESAASEVNVLLSTAFLFFAGGFQLLFFGLVANLVVRTGDRRNVRLCEIYPTDGRVSR